ncbi:MAG: hypothetical protein EON58_14005, partial [Alphaproteobacteria bacterium]
MTSFIRLSDVPVDQKGNVLKSEIHQPTARTIQAHISSFDNVPGKALVYWLSEAEKRAFAKRSLWKNFDTRCGPGTLDDFRFLRLWWEHSIGSSRWVPFPKGGAYSPFVPVADLDINWNASGLEIKTFVEQKVGSASRKIQGQDYYFRSGLTWSRRPHVLGSFQFLPAGCIFSDGSPAAFNESADDAGYVLGITNSAPFLYLLDSLMPRGGEGGQSLKYETGYVCSVPVPHESNKQEEMLSLVEQGWRAQLTFSSFDQTNRHFRLPGVKVYD